MTYKTLNNEQIQNALQTSVDMALKAGVEYVDAHFAFAAKQTDHRTVVVAGSIYPDEPNPVVYNAFNQSEEPSEDLEKVVCSITAVRPAVDELNKLK